LTLVNLGSSATFYLSRFNFYFYSSRILSDYFYFYSSKILTGYFYFYSSRLLNYFLQHWLPIHTIIDVLMRELHQIWYVIVFIVACCVNERPLQLAWFFLFFSKFSGVYQPNLSNSCRGISRPTLSYQS